MLSERLKFHQFFDGRTLKKHMDGSFSREVISLTLRRSFDVYFPKALIGRNSVMYEFKLETSQLIFK